MSPEWCLACQTVLSDLTQRCLKAITFASVAYHLKYMTTHLSSDSISTFLHPLWDRNMMTAERTTQKPSGPYWWIYPLNNLLWERKSPQQRSAWAEIWEFYLVWPEDNLARIGPSSNILCVLPGLVRTWVLFMLPGLTQTQILSVLSSHQACEDLY
jgi:hypothetical protein